MSNIEYLENFMKQFNTKRKAVSEYNALFDSTIPIPDILDLEKGLGIMPPNHKTLENETILPWEA